MNMFLRTLTVSLLFSFSAQAATLEEALVSSYNTNPTLLSERENLKSTDEQIFQALSGFLPTISANLSRGFEDIQQGRTHSKEHWNTRKSLELQQPIFNGGETLVRINQAKNSIKAGRATLRRVEQDVLLDTVRAYMDLLQAQEVLKLSIKNEETLRKHLQFVKERFKLGEVTRTDVAHSEARLSGAITEKLKAKGNVDVAESNYRKMTGATPGKVTMPVLPKDIPTSLDEALRIAHEKNPALETARYNVFVAENNVTLSKTTLLPDVTLRAARERARDVFGLGGDEYDSTSATFNVSVPLYQAGGEYSRIRASKNQVDRRKQDAEATYNEITQATIEHWRNLEVARSTVKSTKDAVGAAAIALEGITQEAEVGTRSTLDVLDTEHEYFTTQVNHVRAKHDEVISAYSLKGAMGVLTAKDLKLATKVYDPDRHYARTKWKLIGF